MDTIREVCQRRGVNGIRSMGRSFRIMDDNGNKALSREELRTGLQDYGVDLTEEELDHILRAMDVNSDGSVDVTEFLKALRGEMSAPRAAVVDEAYDKFDRNRDGQVTLHDLRGTYSWKGQAEGTENLESFLHAFDSTTNPDGRVTREEFHNYYAGVSAGIDNDEHFIALVVKAWRLDDDPNRPRAMTVPPVYAQQDPAATHYMQKYGKNKPSSCWMDFSIEGDPHNHRVVFQLFTDKVPKTCENFRALCTGERGIGMHGTPLHYKGLSIHRIKPRFLIQGGDVVRDNGLGIESIYGNRFEDEGHFVPHDRPGILTMANCGPNTNGSQFCVMLRAAPELDPKHVAFGVVTENLEVIERIGKCGTDSGKPVRSVMIVDCGECEED